MPLSPIQDEFAAVVGWFEDERLYSHDGDVIGWLHGDAVYTLRGKHVGWLERGQYCDARGRIVAIKTVAAGGTGAYGGPSAGPTPRKPPFTERTRRPDSYGPWGKKTWSSWLR